MQYRVSQQHYFLFGLMGLCLLYLVVEIFFNRYAAFLVDEFWFAHIIYHYKEGLPYRDFAPYKTVLGYYLLLVPFLFSHGVIHTLIFTKNILALLNAAILFCSAWWIKRFFSSKAILVSLILLISTEIVLSCSTNIRVDLLAYWFGFFSLLFLLEQRYLFAGILIGLGFAISQKAIWYIFASNCALVVQYLIFDRHLKTIWNMVKFNIMTMLVIGCYILIWSWNSDLSTVLTSVFSEASVFYHLDWYDNARPLFWSYIILYNPLVVLLWPLTLVSILVTYDNDNSYYSRVFILTYSLVILVCLIPYKMIFPYYMQIAIPIFLMLYAAFFTWFFAIFKPKQKLKMIAGKRMLWVFLLCYIITIIGVSVLLHLPKSYLLVCLIPLLLGAYITNDATVQKQLRSFYFLASSVTMLFMGIIYPLTAFTAKLLLVDGAYQKANIQNINTLLEDGSDYVAGVELIYNKTQPIAGLRQLVEPAIGYLYHPSQKLRRVMLPSLYEDPSVTADSVVEALKKSSVKFYVNNYRIQALPNKIKNYLISQYEHFWGSIYLYAPIILPEAKVFIIKFSGKYCIESNPLNSITINGKPYHAHSILYLAKGQYVSSSNGMYRLKLIPEQNLSLDKRFQQDEWYRLAF